MKAPWIKNALIGVNENTPIHTTGSLGNYLQKIAAQPSSAAQNFSLSVGIWAACQQAAFTPIAINEEEVAPLASIHLHPENTLPDQHPLAHIINEIFIINNPRLICESFQLLAQKNIKLPTQLLSTALDTGRRSTEIRNSLLKVIGLRGSLLARFNSDWKYATSNIDEKVAMDDERLWFEGNLAQREDFFKRCRQINPEHARELLENELKTLPAKERFTFVDLLEVNLCSEDETLLNALLSDRSNEVKERAAQLLSHLPESAYAKQITQIMQTLILPEKKLFKNTWACEPPTTFIAEWKQLGLTEKRPSHFQLGGERAWWLYQLVSKTPLRWWSSYTGMSVDELAKWSAKTDWAAPLRHGWQASMCTADLGWIKTLFEKPQLLETKQYSNLYSQLRKNFALLPNNDRANLINSFSKEVCKNLHLLQMLNDGLPLECSIPSSFSEFIFNAIYADYASSSTKDNYQKRHIYHDLIYAISPDVLMTWKKPEKKLTADHVTEIEWMNTLDRSIILRQKLHQQFNNLPQPPLD